DPPEQVGEVLAVDVFHRRERAPVHVDDVVHAAHVRVRDLPGDPHLAEEARVQLVVLLDALGQELERNGLPESEVVGPVDLAHPAPAEQRDDPESARHERAGKEAAVAVFAHRHAATPALRGASVARESGARTGTGSGPHDPYGTFSTGGTISDRTASSKGA